MSLTISSGRSFRYASKPVFADSATSTLAPHSSSIARMTSRVSSSSSTTSTVVPSSSMGDGCTPPGAPAIWGIFFRRPGYARRNEDALTRSSASPPRFRCRKGSGILFAKARGRRCSMQAFVVLLTAALVLVAHVVAVAGPGDPRLVNGVLEWPRTVTNEPFLVVRGDDGVLYYVGIAAARRDGPLAGGARVSVLGLEGRTANEITALGVGAGETTEAALAHLQGGRPAPRDIRPRRRRAAGGRSGDGGDRHADAERRPRSGRSGGCARRDEPGRHGARLAARAAGDDRRAARAERGPRAGRRAARTAGHRPRDDRHARRGPAHPGG